MNFIQAHAIDFILKFKNRKIIKNYRYKTFDF